MLGLNDMSNPIISYYRGMKEDRAILQNREAVPKEIRELFGEIEDLPTRIAITLAKQGELAARMRMLATIYEQGSGKWYVDQETFRSSDQYARFTEQLSGEAWGPLDGARVTPEIAAALNDGLDIFTPLSSALAQGHATVDRAAEVAGGAFMEAMRRGSSIQKFLQIVVSPFNTAANFLGSWAVIAQNGGASQEDMMRAMSASTKMLTNQLAPGGVQGSMAPMTRDSDLELFLKYTLLDSAVGQELRSTPSKFLKQLVVDLESSTTMAEVQRSMRKAVEKAGNAKGFITEAFALSDAWVKPAIFLSRVRFLERVNTAENKGWTREQMEKMAADMTKDTTISFQRGAPAIKLLERMPLTWYATYIQGVFRSTSYSFAQGTKDFLEAARAKTPEGRLLYALEGAKRLSGAMAATAGAAVATKALAEVLNSEEEEDYLEGAKKLLYAEGRYGDGIYLGKNDKGNATFMRLSRLDPNGPVNDMIRIALSDDDESTKTRAVMEHAKGLWIMPRTTADTAKLIGSVFLDDPVKNKKTKIERVFPETSMAFKQALPADYGTAEATIQLIDGFLPGITNAFDQESAAPKSDQNPFTWLLGNTLLLTGGRVDVADPGSAAFSAGNRLDTLQKEGRSQISEAFEIGGPQAAIERYEDLREAELNAFYKLKDVYDGLTQMGMSPRQAASLLKDNKVQAQDIALIMKGRIPDGASGLLDADSLRKSGAIQDRGLPNNGNPNTVYNQTPRGGFLPPVSNAYDEWRINPAPAQQGFGALLYDPVSRIPFGGLGGGSGGTLPVLPSGGATTPPTSTATTPVSVPSGPANPGVSFPIGSGGWMLGGPTRPTGPGINYAGMNTGYTTPNFGMGISGTGFNGMRTGGAGTSGFSMPNVSINRTLGNILDYILPGDAIQNGNVNWANLGLGVVDQYTGLPVTWGLDRLADSNWAQTSDSRFAEWLRDWNFSNEDAAIQQYYMDNGIIGAPTGWLTGAFDYLNPANGGSGLPSSTTLSRDLASQLREQFLRNLQSHDPNEVYAREGAAGLLARINPATGARYTPAQINAISQQSGGPNIGIGNAAAGAMGSRFADVIQGDAARDAFRAMYMSQLMSPTQQVHDLEV
jgi:hypothetical protein